MSDDSEDIVGSDDYTSCSDPVCLASSKALVQELKHRFSMGVVSLFAPTIGGREGLQEWVSGLAPNGYVEFPDGYQRSTSYWGPHHVLLGVLVRAQHRICSEQESIERDVPDQEVI